jgi:hypothetical protein
MKMENIKNLWINANKHAITEIQKQLVSLSYSGEDVGGINVMKINNLIGNCLIEISRLQNENDLLRKTLEKKEEKS